jgi:hypothetical protein
VFAFSVIGSGATGGYTIDGTVPDNANMAFFPDPVGSTTELGAINSNTTKLGVVHTDALPTLGFNSISPGNDLSGIWLDTKRDQNGHVWLYFAWSRASASTGQIVFEFQKAAAPGACNYTGIDQVDPITQGEQSLIDGCNPWKNRQTGDFMFVWDQQGQKIVISKRTFTTGSGFDAGVALTNAVSEAKASSDGLRGEAAVDLTQTVFGTNPTTCTSFANIIPSTITGNSDTADFKDSVFADFASIVSVSNCGSVKIVKDAVPNDAQDFSFTSTLSGCSGFALDDDSDSTLSNQRSCSNVLAGSYSVTETNIPNGWSLTGVSCTDGTNTYNGSTSTGAVTFTVAVDKQMVCTYTNTKDAKVTIVKNAQPDSSAEFSYGGGFGSFSLQDNGDETDGKLKSTSFTIAGSALPSGTVSRSLTESALSGWALTNIVCSGGSPTYTGASSGTNGFEAGDTTANLTIGAGADITCTYTNTKNATVMVVKDAQPDSAQSFSYSGGFGAFSLQDNGNEGDSAPSSTSFTVGGAALASGTVSRSVTEAAAGDWDLTNMVCSAAANPTYTGASSGTNGFEAGDTTANLTVHAGDSITCTYTNTKDATVTVVKNAEPNGDAMFSYTGGLGDFSLQDNGDEGDSKPSSRTFTIQGATLSDGAHQKAINEVVGDAWELAGIVCSGDDDAVSYTGGNADPGFQAGDTTANITVDAGESITCTYTNQSKHVVIVVVCHQGTNTLDPSDVTIDPDAVVPGATKTTAGAADLAGTGIAEDKLCSLGAGNFGGLDHVSDKPFSVTIAGHP